MSETKTSNTEGERMKEKSDPIWDTIATELIANLKLGTKHEFMKNLDLKTLRDLRGSLLSMYVLADLYHSIRVEQSIGGVKGVEVRERRIRKKKPKTRGKKA